MSADTPRCTVCGRDNDYGTHAALEATGHLSHSYTPRRPFVIDAAHIAHQREWSARTFGPGDRTAGVIDHIRKELDEIAAKPDDIEEWADLIILAFDGAWRADHDPQAILDAVAAKQAKNEARTWPDWRTAEPGKAIEHVREGEHPTDAAPDRGVGPVTAIVRYESARSLGIDANATIVCTDRWVVALGEYADEGEPEVLVHVGWAVDADGNDIRKSIARRIAAMLDDDALDGTS